MLGGKDTLPMYRNSSGSRLNIKLPEMSFETALSVAWSVVSVLILLGGILHCWSSSQYASLACTAGGCNVLAAAPEGSVSWQFDRASLVVRTWLQGVCHAAE